MEGRPSRQLFARGEESVAADSRDRRSSFPSFDFAPRALDVLAHPLDLFYLGFLLPRERLDLVSLLGARLADEVTLGRVEDRVLALFEALVEVLRLGPARRVRNEERRRRLRVVRRAVQVGQNEGREERG